MRKGLLLVLLVFMFSGCMSAKLKRDFEGRLERITEQLQTKERLILSLRQQLSVGEITQEDYNAKIVALQADVTAISAAKIAVDANYKLAKESAREAAMTKAAEITKTASSFVGPIANTVIPGSGFIIGLLGTIATSILSRKKTAIA